MQSFSVGFLLVSIYLVAVIRASPISQVDIGESKATSTSPRIFCTTRRVCEKFEVPIVRWSSMPTLPHDSFSSTITNLGQLVTEEDRQIRRIMDVQGEAKVVGSEKPWLTPDVQVVLWFLLLCCLTQGVVSGFQWWRKPGDTQKTDRKKLERQEKRTKTGAISESDEDDEANIPVL